MEPEFFIIGAMKCGTTSLHNYLKQHPEICMSKIKETNYFLNEGSSERAEWYSGQFKDPSKICGESSTNYSKYHLFPDIAERLRRKVPSAKFIYLVRDPLDRIVSHYVHNNSKGREKVCISDAIRAPDNKYILTSKYYFQIEAYRKWFDDDRILVLVSEELKHSRVPTLKDVFNFLGVDDAFYDAAFDREYHQSSNKRISQENIQEAGESKVRSSIGEPSNDSGDPGQSGKPILDHDDCSYLYTQMQADINELRRWSGLNFGMWKSWNRVEQSLLGDE